MSADSVRIIYNGAELKSDSNSKKLSELKLMEPITLMISKRVISPQLYVPTRLCSCLLRLLTANHLCRRVPLLTASKELVPAMRRALTEVFTKFGTVKL